MLGDIYDCKQKMAVESITVSTFAKESSQGTESSTTYCIQLVYQVSINVVSLQKLLKCIACTLSEIMVSKRPQRAIIFNSVSQWRKYNVSKYDVDISHQI
jgi:hypothetical protein